MSGFAVPILAMPPRDLDACNHYPMQRIHVADVPKRSRRIVVGAPKNEGGMVEGRRVEVRLQESFYLLCQW